MRHTWQLSTAELIVLWADRYADRLPAPLFTLYPGADAEDWRRRAAEVRAGLRARADGPLLDALGRIAHADVRIAVRAVDTRGHGTPDSPLRMIGGRHGPVATLIRQLPGETDWHSGGFLVSTGDAEWLPAGLAEALPAREPGRLPDTPLLTGEAGAGVDHDYGRSRVRDSHYDAERRSADWLRRPADRRGTIETAQGRSIFGPRGITTYRIDWCDLAGDGRYAISGTAPPIAGAADPARLAALITADITKVLQTLEDERRA